jgi:hypothetical protein
MYWRPEMDGSMQMWYHQDERFDDAIGSQNSDDAEWVTCTAPLYQQAFRWFREKYNMVGEINSYYSDKKWSFNYDIVTIYKEKASDRFNTYEEAELECLLKLIEIVKEK